MNEMHISRHVTIETSVEARAILKSRDHRSDRLQSSYRSWASVGCPQFLTEARTFFSTWLMYREGEIHSDQRRRASSALRDLSRTWEFFFCDLLPHDFLTETDIETLTCHAYMTIFGVTAPQLARIREISRPLSLFVGDAAPSEELQAQVDHAFSSARAFLNSESFLPLSWPLLAQKHGVDDPVIMNVLIDSFDPIHAALSTVVLAWARSRVAGASPSPMTAIEAALAAHPPFRYINRIKWVAPDTVEKHAIDVKACAASDRDSRPLYFGVGRHSCLGQRAARTCAEVLWHSLDRTYDQAMIDLLGGESVCRSGMCATLNLNIGFQWEGATETEMIKKARTLSDYLVLLGKELPIRVDRPLGSVHPSHANIRYTLNYGFVPGTLAPDACEIDAYLVGVEEPVEKARGLCIAVIERIGDIECKLVVAADGKPRSIRELTDMTWFQEQSFQIRVHLASEDVK